MSFGKKLKMIRLEHNLDQIEMSEILLISQPVYSRYENDKKVVNENSPIAIKVAECFKVTIESLVEDEVKNKTTFKNADISSSKGIDKIQNNNINVPKDTVEPFLNIQKLSLEILHTVAKIKNEIY